MNFAAPAVGSWQRARGSGRRGTHSTMPKATENPPRRPDGKFPPGVSGNPGGRPRKESSALREKLADHGEAVAQVVIDQALAGDMTAAKLVLDRLAPPFRPVSPPVAVELPEGATKPAEIAAAILRAATGGSVPPDAAGRLVTACGSLATLEHLDQIKERLAALEKATATRSKP